jgi:hypothetical protein
MVRCKGLSGFSSPCRRQCIHGCLRDCYWRNSLTTRGGSGPSACLLPLKEVSRRRDPIRSLGAGALRIGHDPEGMEMLHGGDHINGLHGSQKSDNVDDPEETQQPASKLAGGDLVLPSQHRLLTIVPREVKPTLQTPFRVDQTTNRKISYLHL